MGGLCCLTIRALAVLMLSVTTEKPWKLTAFCLDWGYECRLFLSNKRISSVINTYLLGLCIGSEVFFTFLHVSLYKQIQEASRFDTSPDCWKLAIVITGWRCIIVFMRGSGFTFLSFTFIWHRAFMLIKEDLDNITKPLSCFYKPYLQITFMLNARHKILNALLTVESREAFYVEDARPIRPGSSYRVYY